MKVACLYEVVIEKLDVIKTFHFLMTVILIMDPFMDPFNTVHICYKRTF